MNVRACTLNPLANAVNSLTLPPRVVVNKLPHGPIGNPVPDRHVVKYPWPRPRFGNPVPDAPVLTNRWPRPPLGNPVPDIRIAVDGLAVKEG